MVRTMSLIRALISTARMVRHTPRLADGLSPDDSVLLDAPDEWLGPALVAAALGDHKPAAKLLATTRDAAEWENRDRYVTRLAAFAHNRGDWLSGWLAATPRDPDALLVKAELAVRRAWESPARAERLREVGPLIDAAAGAAPRDPVPWRLALDHARGTHATHTAFEALWEQAVRRSSHHYGCHVAALQYLSAVWYGSHRECFDFAERAAEDALPGSLVQALPVRAAFALLLNGDPSAVQQDRIDAAADLAIALSAEYAAGDPWPAEVRNLLAYVLIARRRWAEALEQFRLIGPNATSFPWNCLTDDPLGQFLEARDGVRIEVASTMPLRRTTSAPAPASASAGRSGARSALGAGGTGTGAGAGTGGAPDRPPGPFRGRAGQSPSGGHYA
ncbi:hypothetical protein [Streptomyces sp. FIT100]|uniref:hypothetical protein n=1 Tax=Streptomyces sp. FIT100 TaxID=2837956 RepID=UPI0021CACE4E|nr:hypothetical protein [Streptomyces sp. FIT100]